RPRRSSHLLYIGAGCPALDFPGMNRRMGSSAKIKKGGVPSRKRRARSKSVRHELQRHQCDHFGDDNAEPYELADVGTTDRALQLQNELALELIEVRGNWWVQRRQLHQDRPYRRGHRHRTIQGLGTIK